jgi:hypothetical protein
MHCLTAGGVPRKHSRRLSMAFRLHLRKRVDHELQRLARKELAAAIACVRQDRHSVTDVHAARKSIKKVRAIHRLVKADDGSGSGSRRLHAVNHVLSQLRDADVTLDTLGKLRQADRRLFSARSFAQLRRRLAALQREATRDVRRGRQWSRLPRTLRRIRDGVRGWDAGHHQFGALEAGIRQSLEEGRDALSRARRSHRSDDFHAWRKAVKALWYQLRLLEECGPDVQRDIRALHRAESALGDDHDFTVLCAMLATSADMRDLILVDRMRRTTDRQHARLRRSAIAATRRLYSRSPDAWLRRLKRLWEKAR